jgi:hypothetical protein
LERRNAGATTATVNEIKTKEDLAAYDAGQKEPLAPPASPAAKKTSVTGNLRAVEGTGDALTRKVAERVEARALESNLTDGFGDLPTYRQVSMADQAKAAVQYLGTNYEDAKAVAMGDKAPPKGLLPESVALAVENRAIAEGDADLLYKLGTESKLVKAGTTMGQRIRVWGERDDISPVGAVQQVQKAREADLERRNAGATTATVNEIKAEIKKTAASSTDWDDFITTITCEGE